MPRMSNLTHCPHCGAKCNTAKTEQMTPVYREITYVCTNDECGYVFVAALEPIRSLDPSKKPNPTIHIPFRNATAAA